MKICVIGGSVAGLECAINLANDHDVVVYEEHAEIGFPLKCAEGWINFSGIRPYVKGRKVKEIRISLLDDKFSATNSFIVDGKVLQIVSRPEVEKRMADIATKRGAEIVTGKKMTIKEASKKFDLIIDASGYPSQWCREFRGKRPYGFAVQAFCDEDYDSVQVFFKNGLDGYFWIFPSKYGGCKAGVGVFSKTNLRLKELLNRFLESQNLKAKALTAAPLGCYFNTPFLRHYRVPVALVGDAAGLVDRGGGEGITKAIISARILSSCIEDPESYEKRYFDFMRLHYMIANFFAAGRRNWWLLSLFGKARFYNLAVKLLEGYYANNNF